MHTNWDLKAARIAVVALACGLAAMPSATGPCSPRLASDEAGVILSKLPDKGSPQYKELSDLAGATERPRPGDDAFARCGRCRKRASMRCSRPRSNAGST